MFRKDLVLSKFASITPGATVVAYDALWSGSGGDITLVGGNDTAAVTMTLVANTLYPFRVRQVTAYTGTGLLGAN